MDHRGMFGIHQRWLKNPLRLILAWILFMLHTNIPSAQTIHHRIYTLNPSQDTFLNGPLVTYFQYDFVEIGNRNIGLTNGQESRILLQFDVDKFREDSHWGKEHNFNHLNETTLTSATLTMYCIRIMDTSGDGNDVYSDTIHIARVLKSWEQNKVTATERNNAGNLWSEPNLATDGRDATTSLQNIAVTVDSQTCMAGDSFTFDLTSIFLDWLEGRAENQGIVLWAENKMDTRMTLRLASSESGHVEKHPVLEVQLQDAIYKSHECPKEELQCIDGNCVPQNKVCNFVNDCLHGTDEEYCGTLCDFESPCNWTAPATSEGDPGWQTHTGSTPTPNTGPSGGYSESGTDVSGHYIYMEASDKPNNTVSYLVSPTYAESGPQCRLHFQYHMYGAQMGSLELVLKYYQQDKVIWKQDGDQGDRWFGDVIHLGRLEGPFQLMFQATKGHGDESDLALDDVTLMDCSPDLPAPVCGPTQYKCKNQDCISTDLVCNLKEDCLLGDDEDDAICGVVPVGGACTFEDGWCEWFDVVGADHFNWTRHKGSTPTTNTGPSVDHTLGTSEGYYMYIETTKQVNAGTAFLRSRWFDSPPPDHNGECKVRFAYHMYGSHIGDLKLYLVQNVTEGEDTSWLTTVNEDRDEWYTEVAELPTTVTNWYYLQFEGRRTFSYRGDAAIDDVSLSPQCFHIPKLTSTSSVEPSTQVAETTPTESMQTKPTQHQEATGAGTTELITEPLYPAGNNTQASFSSCRATGETGPSQQLCDVSYKYEDIVVTVLEGDMPGDMAGVQVWVVPQSGPYSISANGASGGGGVENPGPSHGAVVEATFNLTEGEALYILVGQEGDKACDSDGLHIGDVCSGQLDEETTQKYSSGQLAGGGGGGGGASYVAKRDRSGRLVPLIIAAGGGGLSFGRPPPAPDNQSKTDGQIEDPGPGWHGHHGEGRDVSGAGGGWNGTSDLSATGLSFLGGGTGGVECNQAFSDSRWDTRGGFGGGGGGCTNGGGGGGYTGGSAPLMNSLEGNGEGGTSFVHKSGIYVNKIAGAHDGPGEVDIILSVICPPDWTVSDDRITCIAPERHVKGKPVPIAAIVGGIVPILLLIIIVIVFLLLVYRRKSEQLKDAEQRMNTADFRLTELRHNVNVDFNPCYSLGGEGSIKVADLKEVPRENLTLTSALGQGAFGEVYHGLFKSSEEKEDTEVAVKTLQETATETDEQDFLMEALIMGNFDHPNIVSLVGVCFSQHPRFILLEYMAGGELKVFLRESRPHDGEPSPLQMTDLLQIALDVSHGCEYLESKHFIHRDIAARNVLLSTKESGRVAKIGDFGMARDIYRSDYYKKGGQALLPVKWMPPEAFMDGVFTVKTDVWAFGVLLWEIMSLGFMPYPGMSNHEVIQFVTKGDRMNPPRYCPTPIHNMMTRCWRQVPDDRPTFAGIHSNLMQCLQDPDIIRTPLPLRMTEMDQSCPSLIRPRNPGTSPVLRVENPSPSPIAPRYTDTTTPTKLDKDIVAEVNGNVTWAGRNGVDLQFMKPSQTDINANTETEKKAKSPGLKVEIPPVSESNSPRRESTPNTPSQYANPSYAYNSPTPTANPQNPFSSFANDHDSASEKSDLISRDEETNQDLTRNGLTRSSKQKSGSRKASLTAFLRQSSKDTDSSGSSRSTTPSPMPSPSPTSLMFSRQGSTDRTTTQGKDQEKEQQGKLPNLANGKAGKDKSPARVLRYNTSDGCILFEEEDDGQMV